MSEFFGSGTFDLFLLVNLALAAGWYAWASRRARMTGTWLKRASFCFYLGLGLIALTYLGPIAAWSHTFFWAHMTQHLVVMMVVAPLLVLGNPVTLAFRASSPATRRRWVVPILRSRAVRILTNPWVTWFLFAGALLGTHFTPFYDAALQNHDLDYFVEQPLESAASAPQSRGSPVLIGHDDVPRGLGWGSYLLRFGTPLLHVRHRANVWPLRSRRSTACRRVDVGARDGRRLGLDDACRRGVVHQ